MVMFEYKGSVHLMVSFENKSVQIFDYSNGHSVFEFDFSAPERTKRPEPASVVTETKRSSSKVSSGMGNGKSQKKMMIS
jgi:hypothetical protein